MIKYCPIISYQKQYSDERNCMEEACAFWDEERGQCCILTQALAAAGKPSGEPNISRQAEYVYGITTSPAVVPNNSGDWVNPTPYRIDCSLEKGV